MVRLLSIAAGFIALFTAAEACSGWYQCKNSDGSHCCVRFHFKCLLRMLRLSSLITLKRLLTARRDRILAPSTALEALIGPQSALVR